MIPSYLKVRPVSRGIIWFVMWQKRRQFTTITIKRSFNIYYAMIGKKTKCLQSPFKWSIEAGATKISFTANFFLSFPSHTLYYYVPEFSSRCAVVPSWWRDSPINVRDTNITSHKGLHLCTPHRANWKKLINIY